MDVGSEATVGGRRLLGNGFDDCSVLWWLGMPVLRRRLVVVVTGILRALNFFKAQLSAKKSHPTYGVRGAVGQFDVVKAAGLIPLREELAQNNMILKDLIASSCQEMFCYERAELLVPTETQGPANDKSNIVPYQHALNKSLQSYIQAARFAPPRWAAPGVLPVYDEDGKDTDSSSLFDEKKSTTETDLVTDGSDGFEENEMEDGELEGDTSSYRVLSSKAQQMLSKPLLGLEAALNVKFKDKGLLIEAITHASRPSSGVSCYQRLEFVGDAVLDHLITRRLFSTYTDLPPGRLTDLRAAAILDFVKEVKEELCKPGLNSFGLGDCKAPKVLGDIAESIAGAISLNSGYSTSVVWNVFQPLLQRMVTPETLPMHPVRELQERCQQQAEGLEYKDSRCGNVATVEVYVDGVQIGVAQNPQKKMAQKLAARNALLILKEKETVEGKDKSDENEKKRQNGNQTFTRRRLNDICLRKNWPMLLYRLTYPDDSYVSELNVCINVALATSSLLFVVFHCLFHVPVADSWKILTENEQHSAAGGDQICISVFSIGSKQTACLIASRNNNE
ncbi:Endoribonuclease Dicer homolog 1-like protein [Drosera capensis]